MDGPTDAGAGAAHESDAARVERVWRRFSPAPNDIVPGRCYARLWGDGKGTQCTRHPKPGCATCTMHSRFQPHGLVTGPIPPKKLQEFLKAELRRSVRASAGNADAGAARLSAAAGPPRRQRHRHWYTRARMWAEASLLDTPQRQEERGREIHSLEDLTAAEYASCLDRVDAHFRQNQTLQAAVGRPSGFVERDKGPRTADERASQAADYNGRWGREEFQVVLASDIRAVSAALRLGAPWPRDLHREAVHAGAPGRLRGTLPLPSRHGLLGGVCGPAMLPAFEGPRTRARQRGCA